MGVVMEFTSRVLVDKDKKCIYLSVGYHSNPSVFQYCISFNGRHQLFHPSYNIAVFLNIKDMKALLILKAYSPNTYNCCILKFWLKNDLIVFEANTRLLHGININEDSDFKDKYAAYLLDEIINE